MDFYLDDDSADLLLARLLRNAGHYVLLPVDIGRVGSPDAVHFRQAIRQGNVLLSRNHDDFLWLHELVVESHGHHPGIVIVRRMRCPRISGHRRSRNGAVPRRDEGWDRVVGVTGRSSGWERPGW